MPELPEHPDLDQLRRQARELLRDARAGDRGAVARVGAVSEKVSLSAAQLVIARDHGFASWPALKAGIEGTRRHPPAPETGSAPASGSGSAQRRPKGGWREPRCSFCAKSARQVEKLIAGPDAYICSECVGLCQEIIAIEASPGNTRGAASGTVDRSVAPEIRLGPDGMTVRVRLAEDSGPWTKGYSAIARTGGVDASVREEPGRMELVVTLHGATREPEILDALDRALVFVADAKAAARNHEAAAETAQRIVHRWWEQKTRA